MLTNLLFLFVIHLIAWVWGRKRRSLYAFLLVRSASVAAVALLSLPLSQGGMRSVLIAVLAVVWSGRSISHHLQRERRLGPRTGLMEWRKAAGALAGRRVFTHLVLLQTVLVWACTLPIQRGILTGADFSASLLDQVGLVLFAVGLGFEALADHQRLVFLRGPGGRRGVLTAGLWHWSRHPNHFGTVLVAMGFYNFAAAGGDGLWSAVGPALTLFVMTRVAGGPASEVGLPERRPGYRQYQQTTSPFVPRPPRDPADAPLPDEALRYLGAEGAPNTTDLTDD